MTPEEINAKDKIFQAVTDLIAGGEEAERMTTRQIAARAGVNPALINYHYQTKENLLSQVVGMMMGGLIRQVLAQDGPDTDAETRLKHILTATADAAFEYHNVCRIAISNELKQGCANSCEMVMPLLKELSKKHSESDLKIMALQLMVPFHHIVLEPEIYNRYLQTDFFNAQKRRQTINQMVDCFLTGLVEEAKK